MRAKHVLLVGVLWMVSACSSIGIGIIMQVSFDQPVPPSYASEIATRFGSASSDTAPTVVNCDRDYRWSNAVGTYHVQRACGSPYAPGASS
jgi:hypothetical protein